MLNFERLDCTRCTFIKVELSTPLVRSLQADNHYALINWKSFISLGSAQLRLLYFYFCLNVRPSRYFVEFSIDQLVNKLYILPVSSSQQFRKRRMVIRKLLRSLFDNQSLLPDFDFKVSLDSYRSFIIAIRVRRLKAYLR